MKKNTMNICKPFDIFKINTNFIGIFTNLNELLEYQSNVEDEAVLECYGYNENDELVILGYDTLVYDGDNWVMVNQVTIDKTEEVGK